MSILTGIEPTFMSDKFTELIALKKIVKNDLFYKAINDTDWQKIRVSLLRTSTQHKYEVLKAFLKRRAYDELAQIAVLNYINALKRGGLVKS